MLGGHVEAAVIVDHGGRDPVAHWHPPVRVKIDTMAGRVYRANMNLIDIEKIMQLYYPQIWGKPCVLLLEKVLDNI